jgi:hypothetical protein
MVLCVVVLLLGLYRFSSKPSLGTFLFSSPGIVCVGAVAGIVGSISVLMQLRSASPEDGKRAKLAFALSLLVCLFIGVAGEVSLRLIVVQKPDGAYVGPIRLLPRFWQDFVEKGRKRLAHRSGEERLIVEDDVLGWTVGTSRVTEDGLYASSAEGLRSAHQGEELRAGSGDCRVALLGDSYTFGVGVSFADTWGAQLANMLPQGCRILNFGVGGYGVGQMYLRYMKDVVSWNPQVVVFAFIDNDILRTLSGYSFLAFPGSDMPIAMPRFRLDGEGKFTVANMPLIKPEAILSVGSITDLPFLADDRFYDAREWDRKMWAYFHHSMLFRLLTSLHPLQKLPRWTTSDNVKLSVNRNIIRSFVDLVSKNNSIPLVVYLPFPYDYPPYSITRKEGVRILVDNAIDHVNLTSCLESVPANERFIEDGHYSAVGHAAVARCLYPVVLKKLNVRSPKVASPAGKTRGLRLSM